MLCYQPAPAICFVVAFRRLKKLASRARRRVQGAPPPEADLGRQREVVDACLAASRGGDFDALLALLDPDVVLRADAGAVTAGTAGTLFASRVVRGARTVVEQALAFSRFSPYARPVLVNGAVLAKAQPG